MIEPDRAVFCWSELTLRVPILHLSNSRHLTIQEIRSTPPFGRREEAFSSRFELFWIEGARDLIEKFKGSQGRAATLDKLITRRATDIQQSDTCLSRRDICS